MLPLVALALALAASDPRVATLDAMGQELDRSAAQLRLDSYEPPYFVAYQLLEVASASVAGRYGAVMEDRSGRRRTISADVRVGDYALDSSAAGAGAIVLEAGPAPWSAPREAPLDGDLAALRNALWLLTDERYKRALASFLEVRSRAVTRPADPDRAASLSREPPVRHVDAPVPFPFDRARWAGAVRAITARFRGEPEIFDARLEVTAEHRVRWLATSEGTRLVTEQALYAVHLQASARAPDGQLLEDGRDFYAPAEAGLPPEDALAAAADAVAGELLALRRAPAIDPYTGPAILEPQAAGVLFHEAVGHRLEGERLEDDGDGQTYRGRIGQAILPGFISVSDDPTLAEVGGTPLAGHYAFDDQGVPARPTPLVDGGRLVGYLLSRKPVRPFEHSNGHGRSDGAHRPAARMANLVVRSTRALDRAALRRRLLEEVRRQGKPFGLVIRDVSGGDTNTGSFGYQAFRGTPRLAYRIDAATGAETLVRGVELVGTPLSSVARILATGDAPGVFDGYCGAESGYVPVSTVSPALLVGEIELQRVARDRERGPILPSPWQAAPAAGGAAP